MLAPRVTPLVVLALAFALAAPPLAGSAPNPSGSGVPVVAFDARQTVTSDEARFGAGVHQGAPVVEGAAPVFNTTFDATWTNITLVPGGNGTGVSGTSTGLRLVDPFGASGGNPRDLYSDGAHVGQYNVTFPSVQFGATGDWTLRDGNGAVVATVYVAPSMDAPAPTLSATRFAVGQPATLTVTVRDSFGNPVPDAKVILRAVPDADPAYALAASVVAVNGTGAPGAGQNGNYAFPMAPRESGSFLAFAVVRSGDHGQRASTAGFTVGTPTADFSIGRVRGSLVAPVSAPIRVANASDLGSATVTLTLDTSVVQVANVTRGTIPGAQTTWAFDNATSTLTILVTTNTTPGASGDLIFANVSLRTVGPAGSTSPLHLAVVEAVHADASPIETTATDGTFRAGILGDANGDGRVDAGDVTAIAQHVVGAPLPGTFVPANADVTHDGLVTGADAMFVRQYLAGLRQEL